MGNNILFQQKREHILQVIHGAIRDYQIWKEAIEQDEQQAQSSRSMAKNAVTLHDVLPTSTKYYCLVDASWKNEKEVGGIGWSLYSTEGIQKLQGSSSIKPTNTPLEAEAISPFNGSATDVRYDQVTFISDCKQLIEETITKRCITEAFSLIHDIHEMSKSCSFSFRYLSRESLTNVNVLAKNARIMSQNYVITWLS
ncbi:hypothetical protein Bca52824_018525 [Brassica carinata]|uniref:RNase H type-1 domain-containing protein n=1 Tax=Brassica carinata TaxID=52824 RepID=A0A8X8AZI3_BRACI|nr:hypothetical protein Bca52824_018524 [Brassica carinata]KAG2315403.1 hypothetical protein Bca52824_018525 [Brassica carinata]